MSWLTRNSSGRKKRAAELGVISHKRDSMAGCVLRVRKDGIEPEALMSSGIFAGARQFEDGFNFTVSDSDELEYQLRDSVAFLSANEVECKNLANQLKPKSPVLDFGLWRNEGPVQSVTFPSSLVSLAGSLGFELCASYYGASDLTHMSRS